MKDLITTFHAPSGCFNFANNSTFQQYLSEKPHVMAHLINAYTTQRDVEIYLNNNNESKLLNKVEAKFMPNDGNLSKTFFERYSYRDFVWKKKSGGKDIEILPSEKIVKIDKFKLSVYKEKMEGWNISMKVFEKILKDSDSTWIDEQELNLFKKLRQKERLLWTLQADG